MNFRLMIVSWLGFCACLNDILIKGYFIAKFVTIGTVFTCIGTKEKIELGRKLLTNGLRINFVDTKNQIFCEKLLMREQSKLGVVVDGNCEKSNVILKKCGKYKLLDESHHWLIIFDEMPNFQTYLKNVTLNINADVNFAIRAGNISKWSIYDGYNPASEQGGELKITKVGSFVQRDGYRTTFRGSKYWIRKNMTGVHFKSAITIPNGKQSVEEYITSEKDREKNSMHRFQCATIRHCQNMYNFSLTIRKTNSWGYLQKNRVFDGLVGLLQRKEVDFGCTPLILKYDRLPVVDYGFGNWILKSAFIFRLPPSSASSFEIFSRPLAKSTWWCLICSLFLVILVVKVIIKLEKRMYGKFKYENSWSFVAVVTLGAFCQQGTLYQPMLTSGRIIILFLFVLAVLIYQFYSGYIVSYLLMDPPREVNTLKDLLNSSLDAGVENILIDRNYFQLTTDPIALELYEKKIKKRNFDGFYEPEDGLNKVLEGGFAFHVETSTAYPIIKKTFPPRIACELEEVKMYRTQPMYTNLQKHSPFKEMLNYCMLRLVENGNMVRLRNFWDSHKPECIDSDYTLTISVNLSEFSCALYIHLFGVILSLIVFLGEIFLKTNVFNKVKETIENIFRQYNI